MIVIGLTGGIAMGKSEVARIMASQGIAVFDSDSEVHQFYASEEGLRLIGGLVPEAIVDGKVDRERLSRRVLGDAALLKQLESGVHAEVRRRRDTFIVTERAKGRAMAAVDVPLLFETGAERDVDTTIVVSAREDLQRERAMRRPGMTAEKLAIIIKRQMPDAEKRRRARHVIETNGSLEDLRERVLETLHEIKREHGA